MVKLEIFQHSRVTSHAHSSVVLAALWEAALKKAQESRDIDALTFALQQAGERGGVWVGLLLFTTFRRVIHA